MNNTFNLKRFILLFKKYSLEQAKTNLLGIAALTGLTALILGFTAYSSRGYLPVDSQALIFIYLINGLGSIYAAMSFTDLGDKRKATGVLTLPASHFEKYLVSWLYTYIIFQVILVGVFYLVDWITLSISIPPVHQVNTLVNLFDPELLGSKGFLTFAALHAIAFWGAIFFEKLHYIKTAFLFFIYLIVFVIINDPLLHLVTGVKGIQSIPFGQGWLLQGNQLWSIKATDEMKNTNLVVLAVTVIIFWVSAFFRLKEKEI